MSNELFKQQGRPVLEIGSCGIRHIKFRDTTSRITVLQQFARMIERIVKIVSQLYIVIDDIDEIAERERFLAFVHRVRRLDNLNIIIVSRPLQDIENGLSHVMKLEI